MFDIKADLSFLTYVFIKVQGIFAPESAPAHNYPAFSDLSNCCGWLHLAANTGRMEYHTVQLELSGHPYILILIV